MSLTSQMTIGGEQGCEPSALAEGNPEAAQS